MFESQNCDVIYDHLIFREALRLAYFVLVKNGKGINFHDFMLFMLEYKPRIRKRSSFF